MEIKRVLETKTFLKQIRKLDSKTQKIFKNKLELLIKNPYEPHLRNHKLSGKMEDFYSFTVKYDLRCIYMIEDSAIVLFAIGSHSEVY